MITSFFKKSTPINYSFLGILTGVFFFLYQFHSITGVNSPAGWLQKAGLLVLLFSSILLSNFK